MSNDPKDFRPNVGMMIINHKKEIFVGKRIDHPSEFWQMPQGGIDAQEEPLIASLREMEEEVGLKKNKVELLNGFGKISGVNGRLRNVEVKDKDGKLINVAGKNIIKIETKKIMKRSLGCGHSTDRILLHVFFSFRFSFWQFPNSLVSRHVPSSHMAASGFRRILPRSLLRF